MVATRGIVKNILKQVKGKIRMKPIPFKKIIKKTIKIDGLKDKGKNFIKKMQGKIGSGDVRPLQKDKLSNFVKTLTNVNNIKLNFSESDNMKDPPIKETGLEILKNPKARLIIAATILFNMGGYTLSNFLGFSNNFFIIFVYNCLFITGIILVMKQKCSGNVLKMTISVITNYYKVLFFSFLTIDKIFKMLGWHFFRLMTIKNGIVMGIYLVIELRDCL